MQKRTDEQQERAEKKLLELQAEHERDGKDSVAMDALRKKLEEDLQAEHDRHESDLAERDFAVEQTQKAYQSESLLSCDARHSSNKFAAAQLAQLSEGG